MREGAEMRKTLAIASLIAFIVGLGVGYWARGFMMRDSCLDSGGRWNAEWKVCERA
jgi:hypothetical protein